MNFFYVPVFNTRLAETECSLGMFCYEVIILFLTYVFLQMPKTN